MPCYLPLVTNLQTFNRWHRPAGENSVTFSSVLIVKGEKVIWQAEGIPSTSTVGVSNAPVLAPSYLLNNNIHNKNIN